MNSKNSNAMFTKNAKLPAPNPQTSQSVSKTHIIGVLLVLCSTVFFSLSGTLTKLITSNTWTIISWRGAISVVFIGLYVLWTNRSEPLRKKFNLGWRGWLLASVGSVGSVAFIASFKLTFVANVAIIYATAPFIAALFAWVLIHEKIRPITLTAALASLIGIAVTVYGGLALGNSLGNLLALIMTISMALYMVLIRIFTHTPVVLAAAASSLQLLLIGLLLDKPFAVSIQDFYLLLLFGITFSIAAILLTEGTRKIPAAEAGLIGAAETPLATIFAWLILQELPPIASFIGGAIVLIVVIGHSAMDFSSFKKEQ